MSSFFTLPASQRKRRRIDDRHGKPAKRRGMQADDGESRQIKKSNKVTRKVDRDESISGSESGGSDIQVESASESEATSEEDETAAERRARLAERYLDNIREEVDETGFDAEQIDKDLIAQRLREDVDEVKGRQYRLIASKLDFSTATHFLFRAATEATTAIAVQAPYVYTVSKDKTLIKWELEPPEHTAPPKPRSSKRPPPPLRRRPKKLLYVRGVKVNASSPQQHGHTTPILSLAASPCGTYVATGSSTDRRLIIWSASTLTPLKTFTTHRDSVTALSFAPQSSSQPGIGAQLFSASADRTIKTYSLNGPDSLAYVETLFGHQDHVLGITAICLDQCVSVGARDRTARLWKVVDEMQSVYRADSSKHASHVTGSVDCVAALPPAHFVTGSDSGTIQLWSVHRKKPVFTIEKAHGAEDPEPLEKVSSEMGEEVLERLRKADTRRTIARGITALASIPGTDVVVSGSWDGWVRVWKVSDDKRSLLAFGVVGHKPEPEPANPLTNGTLENDGLAELEKHVKDGEEGVVRGVINSLAVFERRKETQNEFGGKKEGDTTGLCIVAGTGKEMRLGRWRKFPRGKNGAVVLEVPLLKQAKVNGLKNREDGQDGE
jgi:ribosomal RNA-processing protein 9